MGVTVGNFSQHDLDDCYLSGYIESKISVIYTFVMNTNSDSFPDFLLLMNSVICYSFVTLLHFMCHSHRLVRGQGLQLIG
jgi:hypothetical protein